MAEDIPTTIEKALAINLDPLKYGTIVEIGAGQEVSRWFFQAGGAAGTIAKTMSAYDMDFSDKIYGTASGRRYVSRARLERMLEYEFDLIISRIEQRRPENSRFFAFANTVAAQGFKKRDECHGWLGVRLQLTPRAVPDDIILHVRLLDETNLEQQEALGILGVNLIYGAYFQSESPEALLRSLKDNLRWGRIEIDLVEFRGPTFRTIDNRLMALQSVKESLTRAVLFDPDGRVVMPADTLYKKCVLVMRGEFRPVSKSDVWMFDHARSKFLSHPNVTGEKMVHLAEMTMAELASDQAIDTADFLSRVDSLSAQGFHVLISEFFRYFRVRQYLARYNAAPVAIATNIDGMAEIFRENYYDGLSGGILEGLGQLFPPDTTAYVFPQANASRVRTLEDVPVTEHLQPLLDYLKRRKNLILVTDFDAGDPAS